jgi:hypothetical protein
MHDTYTRLGLHVGLLVIYGPITSGSTSPETLSFMTNQHWFPYVLWNFFSCNLYAYIFIHFYITWPYFTKMQTLQSRDYIFDVTREFQIFVFAFGIFCSANHCHHLLETILSFIHLNFTSLFYCNEIFRFKALLISLMHFFWHSYLFWSKLMSTTSPAMPSWGKLSTLHFLFELISWSFVYGYSRCKINWESCGIMEFLYVLEKCLDRQSKPCIIHGENL